MDPTYFEKLVGRCEERVGEVQVFFASGYCPRVRDLYEREPPFKRHPNCLEKLKLSLQLDHGAKIKPVQGLYIFAELQGERYEPVYVGISRNIFRRLRQHVFGKTKLHASLCYKKAKALHRDTDGPFDELPAIQFQQAKLMNYAVMVFPEYSDYDLYFMEVYLAGRLGTKWNSFRTH